ncbi:iron-sulfur cluster assembly scaffold protein [Ketogulonicigenium vulgare]|uniref:NifU-like protein n=1 Tax=Ketogulonicigenium vulgare (strain WSH-001) TaxID=759362 RepID=F9Y6C5_KETVW|nr:iron-sulfur cluster assembly scaffold protein [Ketogulonicigenium vulgare]ADO42680.1 conserved hypothetical protein [Ketogulonicigenium vulgare Y25]AEM40871.1 NifU-like protein [Ketogulonicigenium vulgare WSH-001]ALJ81030.1 nitrogen fixation protein NifU [Ketogulonicigenium vulgare]ANW33788.1 nitrogen fixation protein NifU [Ketogulonicigenium vulgare]AOZ54588.1 hypothetical protein KVC_1574 [Ketogulonicigenium vulgare]
MKAGKAQSMSEISLAQIYSTAVLTAAADIPRLGQLPAAMASASARAPICGSRIFVTMNLADGRITDFAQHVQACALGQASASLFADRVIGLSRIDVAAMRAHMQAMLTQGAPYPAFDILRPAASLRERHGAMLLVFDATLAAFDA